MKPNKEHKMNHPTTMGDPRGPPILYEEIE